VDKIAIDRLEKVINLVLSSERPMSAYYNSANGRTQTFSVDYDGLTADDEYEMASEVHYKQPSIDISKISQINCKRIAEDIMLCVFIITHLGHEEQIENIVNEMKKFRISTMQQDDNPSFNDDISRDEVKTYFSNCQTFAYNRAKFSGSGRK
jgi:hypothetical protein